jgi:hypothetical protein
MGIETKIGLLDENKAIGQICPRSLPEKNIYIYIDYIYDIDYI